MASNINPYNIDGTFPVAGQDNSSQGFRDNFTNVKNNFTFAQNEISDLQAKAIVASALNGQVISNDMAGTVIRRPQLAAWTQALLNLGTISGAAVLDFNLANFQKITSAGPINLDFSNWGQTGVGALGYAVMRVWINITDVAHTVTLPVSVSIANGDITGIDNTNKITFDTVGNYIFDFSSIDGGDTYQIFDVTRNRASFRDPNLYYNPTVNATLMVGFGSGLNTALALEAGQNTMALKGSISSISVGNLSLSNLTDGTTDTGSVAGHSIVSLRGNLATSTFTPVQNKDYLGYYNAVTYTGFGGTANTFQQSATVAFFATGSNVAYGLGGNIGFFTAKDGDSVTDRHAVYQALGIENDQSVKTYGNTTVNGNLITNGGRIEAGYYYSAPSANFTDTIPQNVARAIYNPSGTIANATVTLPSGNLEAQTVSISSTSTVTALQVVGAAGTTVKPSANITLTAGTGATYFFHYVDKTWYKVA